MDERSSIRADRGEVGNSDSTGIDIVFTDEYQSLIDDCHSILTQRIKNSRVELILAYGEVGERIVNDELYKNTTRNVGGGGNFEFVKGLAEDIGMHYAEAMKAIQFYKKFHITKDTSDNWKQFAEGENISWNKIKTNYLTDAPKKELPEPTERFYCPTCGQVTKEEIVINKRFSPVSENVVDNF